MDPAAGRNRADHQPSRGGQRGWLERQHAVRVGAAGWVLRPSVRGGCHACRGGRACSPPALVSVTRPAAPPDQLTDRASAARPLTVAHHGAIVAPGSSGPRPGEPRHEAPRRLRVHAPRHSREENGQIPLHVLVRPVCRPVPEIEVDMVHLHLPQPVGRARCDPVGIPSAEVWVGPGRRLTLLEERLQPGLALGKIAQDLHRAPSRACIDLGRTLPLTPFVLRHLLSAKAPDSRRACASALRAR